MASPAAPFNQDPQHLNRFRFLQDLVVSLALLVAAGIMIWAHWPTNNQSGIPIPNQPIPLDGIVLGGSAAASVVLIEFSDFECPYCGRFARETLSAIREQFEVTGKIRIGLRHLPIKRLHPLANAAAATAICAGRQGKLWEMHDLLFAEPVRLDEPSRLEYARRLGLDLRALGLCLVDRSVMDQIDADVRVAQDLKVTGTPAILIGRLVPDGRVAVTAALAGAVPLADVRAAIDDALKSPSAFPMYVAVGTVACLACWLIRSRRRSRS
jgi:protein-disulfide isomerase